MATDARRAPAALGGALALVLGLLAAVLAPAQPARADDAGTLHALLNQARNGQGLGSLERMGALDAMALDWARAMAAAGTLSHNPSVGSQLPAGWSRWGENVAQGQPTAGAMHEAWWNSPGHRANMLGDFTHVGLAFLSANGTTWGVQVFAKYGQSVPAYRAPAPAPAQPAPAPAQPAPAAPAPEAAATPDPQPSVIDPKPVPDPSLLPSPSASPSADPSPSGTPVSPSPSPSDDDAPADDPAGASGDPVWLWVALAVAGLAALGLTVAALARRRGGADRT